MTARNRASRNTQTLTPTAGGHTTTKTYVDGIVSAGRVNQTRTGIYSFGPNATTGTFPNASVTQRDAFQIAQRSVKWRLHIRNWNQLTIASPSDTLTGVTAYVGRPLLLANGLPDSGKFASTPTQITLPASTIVGGTEMVSSWVTGFTLEPNQSYMLSYGFIASATGNVTFSGEDSFTAFINTDAGVANWSGAASTNARFLNAWIEYEFADDSATTMLVVGNSLSSGGIIGAANRGALSAWHSRWAAENNGTVATIAVPGAWAGHYSDANARWDYYSGVNAAFAPDVIVYFALHTSDVLGGSGSNADVEGAVAATMGAVAIAKAKYPNARHIVTNLPPRQETTSGTYNTAMLYANQLTHLLASHPDVSGVIDVNSMFTDFANPARYKSAVLSADGTHFTPQAHQLAAQQVALWTKAQFPTWLPSGSYGIVPASTGALASDNDTSIPTTATVIDAIATVPHAASAKTVPVFGDEIPLLDSAASFVQKKLLVSDLVAGIKAYEDTIATTFINKTIDAASNAITGVNSSGTYASRPTVGKAGRLYYATDTGNAYYDNGTTWLLVSLGATGAILGTEPPSASWTTTTLGSSTIAADKGGRLLTMVSAAGDNWRAEYRTLSPTSNYSLTAYLEHGSVYADSSYAGIFLRLNSSGAFIVFGPDMVVTSSGAPRLRAMKWTNATTFSADYGTPRFGYQLSGGVIPKWFRIRDNATNRFFEYSQNGIDWVLFTTTSILRTDFITPDQVGWGGSNSSGSNGFVRLRSFVVA